MAIFAIERIRVINGKDYIYQLVIDGVKQLDAFEADIKCNAQYYSEFKTIVKYMEHLSNSGKLPTSKFHSLKPAKANDPIKEYEFKSDHLRVYCIYMPSGKIIMACGFKNAQKKDIIAFQSLKQRYLSSLK